MEFQLTTKVVDSIICIILKNCGDDQLKVTVNESKNGALTVGLATFGCSMLMGPAGLIVGSVLGGLVAYSRSSDYKSVISIVQDMTVNQRSQLARNAVKLAESHFGLGTIENVIHFIELLPKDLILKALEETMTK